MPFTLYVDADRWRSHLQAMADRYPGLVPVVKGNGYGLGVTRLAAEAARLDVDTVAVGTADEGPEVAAAFGGEVLVMDPHRPADRSTGTPCDVPTERLVHTISDLPALRALAASGQRHRVVLEPLTSMRRHGLSDTDLDSCRQLLDGAGPDGAGPDGVRLEGIALHLPLRRPGDSTGAVAEVIHWLARFCAAGLRCDQAWVSHLAAGELAELHRRHPQITLRPRVGTALWLGDRAALQARGSVLDVHPLRVGDRYGYRQRQARRPGQLVVVSGGTAHGVGMEAPKAVRGVRARAQVLAVGALGAGGHALSPFSWAGRRLWYAEPPHMQVSLLLLPASVSPPAIGEEMSCEVRMTTTYADHVVEH